MDPPPLVQLVVSHQVQRPASNRSYVPRRQRQQQPQRGAGSGTATGWPLAAVRADQASDTADTAAIEIISEITRGVDELHAETLKRNAAAALEGLLEGAGNELKQKVQASILDLQSGLLERETEVGAGCVLLDAFNAGL